MASTPRHLLTQTITITNRDWITTDGVPVVDTASAVSYSIVAAIQPTSAGDALVYGRDTTTQMFDVFADPYTTSGVTWDISPASIVVWNGVEYRIAGKPQDFCTMGVLKKFVIERYNA